MSKKIGVLAEDASDVSVISEILEKYLTKSSFAVRKFVGNGCGKLRNKCGVWARQLTAAGCDHIIVVHDLDRNNEAELRAAIEVNVCKVVYPNSTIVIPIEELEAWLLADVDAIKEVFSLTKPLKPISNCEAISSPKEHLRDLVWRQGRKRYLNTTHNQKIAKKTTVASLQRCPSYLPLDAYIRNQICAHNRVEPTSGTLRAPSAAHGEQ